eukprot:8798225-Alexandrium_andersonii.AAC.1
MLVGALISTRHAGVPRGSQQVLELGTALLRAAGAGSRAPLARPAAFQTSSRVLVLLEHGLGDVHAPRSMLSARPRGGRGSLLRTRGITCGWPPPTDADSATAPAGPTPGLEGLRGASTLRGDGVQQP